MSALSTLKETIHEHDINEKNNLVQSVHISEQLRNSGFFDDIKPLEAISIRELWEYYDLSKRGRKSKKTDFYNYKHIDPFFGTRIVYTLRTPEIDSFKSHLYATGLKDGTVKHILELLRRVINYGILHGKCATIPKSILNIELPKFDDTKIEMLDLDQQARYLTVLDNDKDQLLALLVKLIFVTGIRRGAALGLKWEDIDFTKKLIRLSAQFAKNKQLGYIPMSDKAYDILKEIEKYKTSSSYLFPGKDGGKRNDIRRFRERIKRNAKLPPDFRPLHGLRHNFATSLINSGKVDLGTVQRLLTQEDARVTKKYAHLKDESLLAAAKIVDQAFESAESKCTNLNSEKE